MEIVPDAKRDTLLPIIQRHIPRGSIVYSDGARVYSCLEDIGYQHSIVIHSETFIMDKGVHTNNIENLWSNINAKFKTMCSSNETMLPFHLDEFIYRWNRKFDGNFVPLFFRDIARFYPLL